MTWEGQALPSSLCTCLCDQLEPSFRWEGVCSRPFPSTELSPDLLSQCMQNKWHHGALRLGSRALKFERVNTEMDSYQNTQDNRTLTHNRHLCSIWPWEIRIWEMALSFTILLLQCTPHDQTEQAKYTPTPATEDASLLDSVTPPPTTPSQGPMLRTHLVLFLLPCIALCHPYSPQGSAKYNAGGGLPCGCKLWVKSLCLLSFDWYSLSLPASVQGSGNPEATIKTIKMYNLCQDQHKDRETELRVSTNSYTHKRGHLRQLSPSWATTYLELREWYQKDHRRTCSQMESTLVTCVV